MVKTAKESPVCEALACLSTEPSVQGFDSLPVPVTRVVLVEVLVNGNSLAEARCDSVWVCVCVYSCLFKTSHQFVEVHYPQEEQTLTDGNDRLWGARGNSSVQTVEKRKGRLGQQTPRLALSQCATVIERGGKWVLDWLLCDIWISLDVLLCTASILSLCAISIDRYLAITQPLNYSRKIRSKRLAMIMILAVWMVAAAITCPPILGWYDKDRHINSTSCTYNQNVGYVVFSAMGSFFIPLIVMLYVYARISCVIAHRHSQLTALDSISQDVVELVWRPSSRFLL
uniref:(California timema) hypothetical protein n=1 Tax=Timema californicum TaxID=61474 RepID=A0A7R9PC65_TIMCA|nr:unnamed protein product [Timema californicum]